MKTIETQVFSPAWVQRKLEACESFLIARFRELIRDPTGLAGSFVALAAGTILLFAFLPKGLWPADSFAEKSVKIFIPVCALITCFWKIFFPRFLNEEKFLHRWNLLLFLTAFFVFFANANTAAGRLDPALFGLSYFGVIFCSLLLQKVFKASWLFVFIGGLFFTYLIPLLVLLLAGQEVSFQSSDFHFVHLARFGMPLILALAESQNLALSSLFQLRSFGFASQLLHPVQWIYFIPISTRNAPTEQSWRENLPLIIPLLLRLLLIAFLRWSINRFSKQPELYFFEFTGSTLLHGWVIYFFYFCLSYVLINSSVLVGRLFGLRLPDGSDYALLATTPLERWRKWNTYFYEWIFRFVFFPFQKSFKKPFLAIQISFMFTYFFHAAIYWTVLFFPHGSELATNEFLLRNKLLFFFSEGVLVFLSPYFPSKIVAAGRWTGWIGVILTHLLMSVTYSLHHF